MAKYVHKNTGKEILVWEAEDDIIPEVKFLLTNNKLKINYENPLMFFETETYSATSFAALIIQDASYDDDNNVVDVQFEILPCLDFVKNYQKIK